MNNLKEIKDAARQAFRDQQSQDTEGGVPDIVSFCAGFLAGYRHLEAELQLTPQYYIVLDENNKAIGKRKVTSKIGLENFAGYVVNNTLLVSYAEYDAMQVLAKNLPEIE